MKKNINSKNSTKTVINSCINSDAIITSGKTILDINIEINPSGTIIPKIHLEGGESTLQLNKEGFQEVRGFYKEVCEQNQKDYDQIKTDLVKLVKSIPAMLEIGRQEVDKMDEWDVRRAKKRGMAYISQEELDQLIEELNELRGATPEEEEDFENVR